MSCANNVVLVVIDALRRDRASPGSASHCMPRFEQRSSGWVDFLQCRSAAPWTLPACTSLLTGMAATKHQRFLHQGKLKYASLVAQFGPEYIKAAFTNNDNFEPSSELHRGFDLYQVSRDHDAGFRRAEEFVRQRQHDGKSFFMLLHTNIAHDYYQPVSRAYYERAFPNRNDWFALGTRVVSWDGLAPAERARVVSIYDGCVRMADEQLEQVLSLLDPDTTHICVTADHGEGFDYDLGRLHHGGRVHEDLVDVPLAIHVAGNAPDRQRERLQQAAREPVGSIDIMPTLLELAGRRCPSSLDGRSLLTSSDSRLFSCEEQRYLYLSSRLRLNTNLNGKNTRFGTRVRNRAIRRILAARHHIRSYSDGGSKLVVTTVMPNRVLPGKVAERMLAGMCLGTPRLVRQDWFWHGIELFDLKSDPQERHNLFPGDTAAAHRMLTECFSGADSLLIPAVQGERPLREVLN